MNQSELFYALATGATTSDEPTTISPGPENLKTSKEESVHISVTVVITLLVGVLFLAVYIQLIMVICFGYKLVSYQTVLLFDILFWAALRLSLYSFYYYHCCELVRDLPICLKWLLVAFPSALQYISLAVLVHYFGQVMCVF